MINEDCEFVLSISELGTGDCEIPLSVSNCQLFVQSSRFFFIKKPFEPAMFFQWTVLKKRIHLTHLIIIVFLYRKISN